VVLIASIITLLLAAVNEMASFYQTAWSNIPEDSNLHTCHHENLNLAFTNVACGAVEECM
jgi:hypothetical protein